MNKKWQGYAVYAIKLLLRAECLLTALLGWVYFILVFQGATNQRPHFIAMTLMNFLIAIGCFLIAENLRPPPR